MKILIAFMFCLLLGCASPLSTLEKMSRPIIVVAKTNYEDERSIVVKDAKGKLLKLTETAFVHSYNPGDTLK